MTPSGLRLLPAVVPAMPFGSSRVVSFLPLRIYPCSTPALSMYSPALTPALLMPPGSADVAPGTLALVNLKVKGGASSAAAAMIQLRTNATTYSIGLQFFIGFLLLDYRQLKTCALS